MNFKLLFIFFLFSFLIVDQLKCQVIFQENFEGVIDNITGLPSGWTEKGLSKDKIYQVGDSLDALFKINNEVLWSIPQHTKFAYTNDISCSYTLGGENCNKSQDRLIFPSLSFIGNTTSLVCKFDSYFSGKLGASASLEYSIDKGISWIKLADISPSLFWKTNTIDISSLNNFSNVLISFKYNDQNALREGFAVDNITIQKVSPWIDLKIIGSDLAKYTIIPSTQLIPLPLNCDFLNQGSKMADSCLFKLDIFSRLNTKKILKSYSKTIYNVKSKDTVKVNFGSIFSNELTDSFEFVFNVFNPLDTITENNSLFFDATISLNEYARDDNKQIGVLGLSSMNTITLGNKFEIHRASYIDSISVVIDKKNMAIGSSIQAVVYPIINNAPISNFIGFSSVYTISNSDTNSRVILKITDSFLSRLKLDSGSYLIAITKYTNSSSLAVKMTNKYFSENAVFVKIGNANFQSLNTYFSGSYKLVPAIRMFCSPFCNLNIKVVESLADCQSALGSLSIIPKNGSYPYKFKWSTNITDSVLSNVKVGKYSLSVIDKFNCRFDSNNIVLNFNTPPRITIDSISHPKCFYSNDGFVSLKIKDNNRLTKIFWNNIQTNTVFNSNLKSGDYFVKVFNDANCFDSIFVELSSPDSLKTSSTTSDETSKEKGEIFLFVSGGVPPYSYFWNDSITSKNRIELEGDKMYQVNIKDKNGCEKSMSFQINKLLSIDEIDTDEYVIYPNPTKGEIQLSGNDQILVSIHNLEGKFISTYSLNSFHRKIDLSEYEKGTYFLKIERKNSFLIRKISII